MSRTGSEGRAAAAFHRDFLFPLNVLTHVLILEEGSVPYLHYGLFEKPDEPIASAQERSTTLLVERLPPVPARVLEVGIGFGTTFARLRTLGYEAEGVTPDPAQIASARHRAGEDASGRLHQSSFETFESERLYDAIVFQESAQYVDTQALLEKARVVSVPSGRLLVLDEFALRPVDRPDALHSLERFLALASRAGFRLEEEQELSAQAAPTIDYFLERIPRHRAAILDELGVSSDQIDELLESGRSYRELYRSGAYGYRLLRFCREA